MSNTTQQTPAEAIQRKRDADKNADEQSRRAAQERQQERFDAALALALSNTAA